MLSILIVDNEKLIRESLKVKVYEILGHTDHITIDLADDGDVAIKMLKLVKYNLLLLDWCMEETSGEMVLDYIFDSEYPGMGVLVLTDAGVSDNISDYLQRGISLSFLKLMKKPVKEIDKKLFKSEIQKLMEPLEV